MTERVYQERCWAQFLWSFSLANHLGEVSESVRQYGKAMGLPLPGDYAELDAPEDAGPENSWTAFAESIGADSDGTWPGPEEKETI